MISFNELPPIMAKRARWAREEILGFVENPKVQIDEDELLAWVYSEEDGLWYSVDGNYSRKSPIEKMAKRREFANKQDIFKSKINKQYLEKLAQIDYWSKIRERILKRDKFTCQICQNRAKSKLHIHHILKRVSGGTDHYDNLITVCPKCHKNADIKLYDPTWKQL